MSDRIPSGYFETIMHFTVPGQSGDVITSFGWNGGLDLGGSDPAALVANHEIMMGQLASSTVFSTLTIIEGSSGPDNISLDVPSGEPGASSGTAMPPNVAWLLQKRTSTGGRRGRGRNYFPGVTEDAVDDGGTVDSGVLAGWATNIEDFLTAMAAGDWTPRLLHQSSPFLPSVVTSIVPQPLVATQRKRLRG